MKTAVEERPEEDRAAWAAGVPFPAISELVPHHAPMTALDAVESWYAGHAVLRLILRPGGPFQRDADTVDASAAFEYMAQGVAACLGMEAYKSGEHVRVGMVVACREFLLQRPWFAVGTQLRVVVDLVRGSEVASHYRTLLLDATDETVASASMTLVHGLEPPLSGVEASH